MLTKSMVRVAIVLACLALVVEALPVKAPVAAQEGATGSGVAGSFEQTDCFFDVSPTVTEGEDVICGYVTVPEDHANPNGATIRLAVVVIKDHSAGHQPDPVIMLSGGPGEKTVHHSLNVGQRLRTVARNRDLILFDQRGVGQSEPALECPEPVDTMFGLLDQTDPAVDMKAFFDALMACRDRLAAEGINFEAYNTTQNAADVGMIGQALGYEQVNLFGGSYGSLLAQATMRDHPAGIRSVVIDSVLPLEKSLVVEASLTTTGALMKLLDTCAADPACNGAYPDLQAVLFDVIDRLNADPVPVVLTNPLDNQQADSFLTGEVVLLNLFTFLYDAPVIPVLPQAIYDVYNGDYDLMTRLSSMSLARFGALSMGMELSVMCRDDLIGYTPEDFRAARVELPPQLVRNVDFETQINYGWFGFCANWPVTEADPSVREPVVSDIPTLVLAGEFDPVTPPEYGALVAGHLNNAHFFEFPGVGHSVAFSNACARSMVAAFFDNPTRVPNASCINQLPGVVFDLPREDSVLELEPFTNRQLGISGVAPVGWEKVGQTYVRRQSSIDPTQIALDVVSLSAEDLFAHLASQLRFDMAETAPVARAEMGHFTWDVYAFNLRGYAIDMAIASDAVHSQMTASERTYLVLLITDLSERDELYETLFVPAVESLESNR